MQLIDIKSPKYAKRIVREIRSIQLTGSVYLDLNVAGLGYNPRIASVQYDKAHNLIIAFAADTSRHFHVPAELSQTFFDGNGQQIVASRHA